MVNEINIIGINKDTLFIDGYFSIFLTYVMKYPSFIEYSFKKGYLEELTILVLQTIEHATIIKLLASTKN